MNDENIRGHKNPAATLPGPRRRVYSDVTFLAPSRVGAARRAFNAAGFTFDRVCSRKSANARPPVWAYVTIVTELDEATVVHWVQSLASKFHGHYDGKTFDDELIDERVSQDANENDNHIARLFVKIFLDAHGGRMPKDCDEVRRYFRSPEGERSVGAYVEIDANGEFFMNTSSVKDH